MRDDASRRLRKVNKMKRRHSASDVESAGGEAHSDREARGDGVTALRSWLKSGAACRGEGGLVEFLTHTRQDLRCNDLAVFVDG